MTAQRSLKKNFFFILVPIFTFLILLELGLRLFGFFNSVRIRCYDPIMGMVYCPNTEGFTKLGALTPYAKINSDGLIDKEYLVNKNPETLRIAVVGDSFTAGEAIEMENQFPTLWENWFTQKTGKKVDVINFGVPATGTWKQLKLFHLKAKKYQPDLVVLVFFWGNDISDNVSESMHGKLDPLKNEYETKSFWHEIKMLRKNFNIWIWNHTALYQFIRTRYEKLENRIKYYFRPDHMKKVEKINASVGKNNEHHFVEEKKEGLLKKNKDTDAVIDDLLFLESEGWVLTKNLILILRNEVQKAGSKLVVIQLGGFNVTRNLPLPTEAFNSFLIENNINSLNAYHYFKNIGDNEIDEYFIPNDGHFNEKGHYEFAQFSFDFLSKELEEISK